MKKFTSVYFVSLIVIIFVFSPGLIFAQESDSLFQMSLEDLMDIPIVTASKTSEKASTAPATVHVVRAEEIAARGYTSLLDVLWDLPGFDIRDYADAERRNVITMRGIESQAYFVILLDGVKISSPSNEIMPIMENYPVYLARQIEVIYGPASALYGADAVAGIINIITKDPTETGGSMVAEMQGGMHGVTNNSLWYSQALSDEVSLTLAGQYMHDSMNDYEDLYADDENFDTQGLESGTFNTIWGTYTPNQSVDSEFSTPYKAYNVYARLQMNDFSFSAFRNMAQVASSVPYTPDNGVYNDDVFFRTNMTMATARYDKSIGNLQAATTLTGSMYEIDPESNFRNVYVGMERGYKYGFSKMLKAEEQLTWTPSDKFSLVGGLSYESYIVLPKGADLEAPVDEGTALSGVLLGTALPNNPDGISADFFFVKYYNLATYLQAQYQLGEKLHFTGGARFDYNSQYGSTVNPRMGIVYSPSDKTTVKALYGTAYLAPTPYFSFAHLGSFVSDDDGQTYYSHYWSLPNPDLEPAYEQTYELNVAQFLGNNFNLSVNAFYIELDNLFSSTSDAEHSNIYNGTYKGWPVDQILVSINTGKQTNYGGTLQLKHSWQGGNERRINSYISLSYIDGTTEITYMDNGTEKTTDAEISTAAPLILKAGLDAKLGKLTVSPRLIFLNKQRSWGFETPENPDKRQTYDGYALVNLAMQYHFNQHFTLFANVYNLLNQDYRVWYRYDEHNPDTEYLHGIAQRKLRINGGLRLRF